MEITDSLEFHTLIWMSKEVEGKMSKTIAKHKILWYHFLRVGSIAKLVRQGIANP